MSVATASTTRADLAPQQADLDAVFRLKYGDPDRPERLGWGPRMRRRFGYASPDDHYEALVARLVGPDARWLDVGCGRHLFPGNGALAQELAARCRELVGVDPDATLAENPFVHEKVFAPIDEFTTDRRFDLVTLRMVAEHVEQPQRVVGVLAACTAPGGLVVVYTVNRWSPVPMLTSVIPFALHQPVKRLLWRTEAKDTFPTAFRMNSRRRLRALFDAAGFDEAWFTKLDDCRTLARFRIGLWAELGVRRVLRALGLRYPENCLLGVYRRRGHRYDPASAPSSPRA